MKTGFERQLLGAAVFLIIWMSDALPCQAQRLTDQNALNRRSGLAMGRAEQQPELRPMPTSQVESAPLQLNFSDQDAAEPNLEAVHPLVHSFQDELPFNALDTTGEELNQSSYPYENANRRARAGCPLLVSKHAATSYHDKYQGYYVGGGVPAGRFPFGSRDEPRCANEGTWGMDYAPIYSRVVSTWSHGRLFQGGIGQYEPDHKNRPFGMTFGKHFGNKDRAVVQPHVTESKH